MSRDRPVRHEALTIVTPIVPGDDIVESLRTLLDRIGDEIGKKRTVDFESLARVHFMRWVILEAAVDVDGREIPASLVLGTDYDPPRRDHVVELVRAGGPTLRAVYEHCVGFPAPAERDDDAVVRYLLDHQVERGTFYRGTPWRSVDRIRREARLRDRIEQILDEAGSETAGAAPARIVEAIRERLRKEPEHGWAVEEPAAKTPSTMLQLAVAAAIAVVGVLVLSPLLLVAVAVLLVKERQDARRDDPNGREAEAAMRARIGKLAEREDHLVVNQMTHLSGIKPGWFRLTVLRAVLLAIEVLARYLFNRGALAGIPTIHFARWVIVDDGRRLLFFSNFDGSWERYLGDFVDRAANGLTGVWSNARGFPATRLLVCAGARAEERFKAWARAYQVRTQVWYAAYPRLSVPNILNNSRIRAGLARPLTDDDAAAAWLRLL